MATLISNPVYVTLEKNIDYVTKAHNQIKKEDLQKVSQYVQGDHANILYVHANGCSKNPKLAAEQFMQDRDNYWSKKNTDKLQGQTEKKNEILAHHFYISFPLCDKISLEEQMQIYEEWLKATGLDAYKSNAAPHVNTQFSHIHASICAYHPTKKKKINHKRDEVYRWRKELNYILVKHGLSIIENEKLNEDPEYKAWFDKVKAEGKIIIHSEMTPEERAAYQEEVEERKKSKRKNKNNSPKKDSLVSEKQIREELQSEFYEQLKRKKEEEENNKQKALRYYHNNAYRNHHRMGRYYSVYAYDKNGRKRGILELTFMLSAIVIFGAKFEKNKQVERKNDFVYFGKTDVKAQRMMDAIATAREYDIQKPSSVPERIRECGADMNSLKKENYRLKKLFDDPETTDAEKEEILKEALRNDVLLDSLKRDYRNLKYMEATYTECTDLSYLREYYSEPRRIKWKLPEQEPEIQPEQAHLSIDALISNAEKQKAENGNKKMGRSGEDLSR